MRVPEVELDVEEPVLERVVAEEARVEAIDVQALTVVVEVGALLEADEGAADVEALVAVAEVEAVARQVVVAQLVAAESPAFQEEVDDFQEPRVFHWRFLPNA